MRIVFDGVKSDGGEFTNYSAKVELSVSHHPRYEDMAVVVVDGVELSVSRSDLRTALRALLGKD